MQHFVTIFNFHKLALKLAALIGNCIKHKSIYYLWSEGLVRSSLRVAGQRDLMLTSTAASTGGPQPPAPEASWTIKWPSWGNVTFQNIPGPLKETKTDCSQEATDSLFFCIIIIGQLYSHFYLLGDKTLEGKMGGTCLHTNFNRTLLSNLSYSHQLIHPPSSLGAIFIAEMWRLGLEGQAKMQKSFRLLSFPLTHLETMAL